MPHFHHACACHAPADQTGSGLHSREGKPHARIDVHHHIAPPFYLKEVGALRPIMPPVKNWSVAKSLEDQDQAGVTTSILTVTCPGFWFGDVEQTRTLCRNSNDYAATLVQDHPRRFGMFVAPPLPDIDGSLREIEYGLDTLKADGVALFTNYRDKWLGDPAFEPVLAELNRRRAVVHVHPDVPDCTRNIGAGLFGPAMLEYATDSSRAIAFMLFTGAAHRYPDINFIWSHAGGTVPFLLERYVREPLVNQKLKDAVPEGVEYELKRFYYDTAQAAHVHAMSSLKTLVDSSKILFGTDFPFRNSAEHVTGLKECGLFSETDLAAIDHGNAHRLLPRIKAWS